MYTASGLYDQITSVLERVSPDLAKPEAVDLLLGTAAVESNLGSFRRQLGGGPALGIFQMEPRTHDDIWDNYLLYRQKYACVARKPAEALTGNDDYAIFMARVHYLRVPYALPVRNRHHWGSVVYVNELAAYWKQYYNTVQGRGTEGDFVRKFDQLIVGV